MRRLPARSRHHHALWLAILFAALAALALPSRAQQTAAPANVPEVPDEDALSSPPLAGYESSTAAAPEPSAPKSVETLEQAKDNLRRAYLRQDYGRVVRLSQEIETKYQDRSGARFYRVAALVRMAEIEKAGQGHQPYKRLTDAPVDLKPSDESTTATAAAQAAGTTGTLATAPETATAQPGEQTPAAPEPKQVALVKTPSLGEPSAAAALKEAAPQPAAGRSINPVQLYLMLGIVGVCVLLALLIVVLRRRGVTDELALAPAPAAGIASSGAPASAPQEAIVSAAAAPAVPTGIFDEDFESIQIQVENPEEAKSEPDAAIDSLFPEEEWSPSAAQQPEVIKPVAHTFAVEEEPPALAPTIPPMSEPEVAEDLPTIRFEDMVQAAGQASGGLETASAQAKPSAPPASEPEDLFAVPELDRPADKLAPDAVVSLDLPEVEASAGPPPPPPEDMVSLQMPEPLELDESQAPETARTQYRSFEVDLSGSLGNYIERESEEAHLNDATKTSWEEQVSREKTEVAQPEAEAEADLELPTMDDGTDQVQAFHPDETVTIELHDDQDQTQLSLGSGDQTQAAQTDLPQTSGEDLFDRERRLGQEDFKKSNWAGAVHHLSIASALRPEVQEIKDKLREARRMRKADQEYE